MPIRIRLYDLYGWHEKARRLSIIIRLKLIVNCTVVLDSWRPSPCERGALQAIRASNDPTQGDFRILKMSSQGAHPTIVNVCPVMPWLKYANDCGCAALTTKAREEGDPTVMLR